MSAIDIVLKQINWKLLREQKITLIGESSRAQETDRPVLFNVLEGVIALLDALQDAAVDDEIATELEIFGDLT